MTTMERLVGAGVGRIESTEKVTGSARYSADYPLAELAHGWIVQSTVARGRIASIDADAVLAMPGVLAVLHHGNARKLADPGPADRNMLVLQSDRVHHHGAAVALVVAATVEQARAGAEALRVAYHQEPHDVVLTAGHPRSYTPNAVNAGAPADTEKGDVDAALAAADAAVDRWYSTPAHQNNPMEPHATTARWTDGRLTVHDSSQSSYSAQQSLAALFSLDPGAVRVRSEHVGGGFGSKGKIRAQTVLAAMAAEALDRPVRVVLTRRQMHSLVGYRTPTIQRVRLGADRDGRLTAVDHTAYAQTSTVLEFTEQTAVMSRMMYAADSLRTHHEVVALDVPSPSWVRAPGEAPGSFALESAMDELAAACRLDPLELRIRNEPAVEPATGRGFGSRRLLHCYREGARLFGWQPREGRTGGRRDGRRLIGTGVAASTYPARSVGSTASATAEPDSTWTVRVNATDVGTGARTALTQIAADELGAPLEAVRVLIGDSAFGQAMSAGGSMGTASWSWAVVKACRALLEELSRTGGAIPPDGLTVRADTAEDVRALADRSRHAYGVQFVEVAVDPDTGEVRVPRMAGFFDVGRVVNAATARSQLIGGMIWGVSMALFEEAVMDAGTGDYLNHDLAGYHVATNADIGDIEVGWIGEPDDDTNPVGVKGIGEVGIVGTAAAIANAVWDATGTRHRNLPITPARVLRPSGAAG
jgi:xanthine dehydrogenase YagR molybdenum-binding subunit